MIQSVKKNQALDLKSAKTKKAVKDPAPSGTDQEKDDKRESSSPAPTSSAATSSSSKKRKQGRPKGDPAVMRSLRIRKDINDRLIRQQELTGLSYNELANRAFDEYLK
ncbi:MAG: hypothetical protein IKF09_02620 [Clostridiales bacterium]|nr:hypothetical protein [Clostridiales bacterium]